MSQACTICRHERHAEINHALVAGEPLRDIASRFVPLSRSALQRHKDTCIPERLVKAAEQEDVKQALDVVQQLKAINNATLQVLKNAREMGAPMLQLQAVDRVHKQIELQAKLIGQLDERPVVNILITPQWLHVRSVLIDALREFPTARAVVADRLMQIEGRSA